MSRGSPLRSLSNVARTDVIGVWGDPSREIAVAPTSGTTVCSAAITYGQKDAARLSLGSSESHAARRSCKGVAASHSATSVVLPKPAGAETRVSFDSPLRLRRSLSLGRVTRPRRTLGM